MQEPDNQDSYKQNPKWNNSFITSCLVSLLSVLFTQFTLFLLPLFLSSSSFLILLPISVVSSLEGIVFNTEIILVMIGLFCIMASDPGRVTNHSSCHGLSVESPATEVGNHEEDLSVHKRVRYCRHFKTYIMGFDHHCPAFGNCIGVFIKKKNHNKKIKHSWSKEAHQILSSISSSSKAFTQIFKLFVVKIEEKVHFDSTSSYKAVKKIVPEDRDSSKEDRDSTNSSQDEDQIVHPKYQVKSVVDSRSSSHALESTFKSKPRGRDQNQLHIKSTKFFKFMLHRKESEEY